MKHCENTNFGFRISDCGFPHFNPQSAIRNPQLIFVRLIAFAAMLLAFSTSTSFAVTLQIATFKVDVTPPNGSPLCDGFCPPVTGVNDPLSARGIVLQAD